MTSMRASLAIFSCVCLFWTVALPTQPDSHSQSSGAGEIPEELPPGYRPFDGILGKGSRDNNYDLDSEEGVRYFPEYEVNVIPHRQPEDEVSEHPYDRIPEDEFKEEAEEEEDHELPSQEKPKGGEKSQGDEKEKTEIPVEEDDNPHSSEEEGTHALEDEVKPHEDKEEDKNSEEGEMKPHEDKEEDKHSEEEEHKPHEDKEEDKHSGEDEMKPHEEKEEDTHSEEEEHKPLEAEEGKPHEGIGLPLKPSLFSFQQVNHYIKQLEKAMDDVFKKSLEEAALLNNTFTNTTDEKVEVNGHKYQVHKSIIKTGDEDSNSTLFIEAVSSVDEDEPKNRSVRSNPDAEPNQ